METEMRRSILRCNKEGVMSFAKRSTGIMFRLIAGAILLVAVGVLAPGTCLSAEESVKAQKGKPGQATETSKPTAASRRKAAGWKWDVTIYDRPGWSATWLRTVELQENDEIVISVTANKEGTYAGDFYWEKGSSDTATISSTDGGLTWHETSPDRFPAQPSGVLADGSMINVDTVNALPPQEEARRRKALKQAGLGHLADSPHWLIFPESMAAELKAKGYGVFDQHPAIPEGQVAVYANKLRARRSTDSGKTWEVCPIKGALPIFGQGPGFYDRRGFIKLPDGTILKSFYGSKLFKRYNEAYVVRSTDQGKTWQTIKIASRPGRGFTETEMVIYPDGRVVAMMRTQRIEVDYTTSTTIHSVISDDMGLTWRPPVDTKINGNPLRLLLLKNGNILCTYCYRDPPAGARACISYDRGETWDYENEIILKNDALATNWISPAGAMSVQLSDGTIFTAYTVVKVNKRRPGDLITNVDFKVHRDHYHSYLVGNRYTEDYVRALPGKRR